MLINCRLCEYVQAVVKRMQENGKSQMTIVGAVMRKLVRLAYGVLKNVARQLLRVLTMDTRGRAVDQQRRRRYPPR